jgi:fucose permease
VVYARESRPVVMMMSTALTQDDEAQKRKRGVRRTAIVFGLIALFFYVGFMVLIVVKGSK